MLKINFKNYNHQALILLGLSISSIFFEIDNSNKIFWFILFTFVIFIKRLNIKRKNVLSSLLAFLAMYIQYKFNFYVLSKEFFLNILILLLILKYLELSNKQGHYFFNYICIFIAVTSLIYGQDFFSSLISSLIIFFSIIHLYILNQKEILEVDTKNIIKLLFLSSGALPLIFIIYLIFPRQEISINILPTQKNTLGIPDKIQLGTFDRISNSSQKIFTYKDNLPGTTEHYFRVKIFDVINNEKDWLSTNGKNLDEEFKNRFIPFTENLETYNGKLILDPHNKKWIPFLKNTRIENDALNFDSINLTYSSNKKIINKEIYNFSYLPSKMKLNNNLQEFYKILPNTIGQELINWADKTYNESGNDKDYISKILNKFSNGEFYYSLKPANFGNNYSKFFLETKEGYCEYFAGTFAILTRLAGIPSRIVSGYYAGEYNNYGKFFNFSQADAHAWVEVWFENEGWIKIDPTAFIPKENIKDSNNYFMKENLDIKNNNFFFSKSIRKLYNYVRYLDYRWTNSLITYDQQSRNNVLKKFLKKEYYIKLITILSELIFLLILLILSYNIFFNKKILYSVLLYKLKKRGLKIKFFHTHQEIFKMISLHEQKILKDIFIFYELSTFQSIDTKIFERLKINFKILKF